MSAIAVPTSPYKGLAPFDDSELDALLFFGREREIEVIVANLMAARLTVLYGASGVGKTSLLRAGVAHRLRGAPGAIVVVFSTWTGDPVMSVLDAVEAAAPESGTPLRRSGALADTLGTWTRQLDTDIYVVLDQFEEYFLYHENEHGPGTLADELPEALRRSGLRVNFLIGIREDSLASLDAFKARIPNLFGNSLRLDRLDRDSARAAIVGPVERYNEFVPTDQQVAAEPEFVDEVLEQVAVGRVDLGQAGRGGVDEDADRIEAPYLQLVLERLWEVETAQGSRKLRLQTLNELGGAAHIVQDHLEQAMSELSPEEKDAAAAMYNHLVTPSGTKIAHRAADLAGYASVDATEAERVLHRLVEERIVRAGEDGAAGPRYEIFHDVLADAVLAWRARHEAERQLQAERVAAARRHRRMLSFTVATAVAMAVLAAIAVYALVQRGDARSQSQRAHARELVALARTVAPVNPERSVRLALQASRLERSSPEEEALRSTLRGMRVKAVLSAGGKPVNDVEFSRDGKLLVTAGDDGTARIHRTDNGRRLRSLRHGASLTAATFSPDGSQVVTAGSDGVARIWNTKTGQPVHALRHGGPVTSATFSPDGRVLATTSEDGTARIWDPRTGSELHRLDHPHEVESASFSSDGRLLVTTLVSSAHDRIARVFDVGSGRLVARLVNPHPVTSARFAPVGDSVVTGDIDTIARLWDGRTGARGFELTGHTGPVLDAEFSPAADLVVTASADESGRVWDAKTGLLVGILQNHGNYVLKAVFSPNGKFIATASRDRTARVFDTDGTLKATLVGHRESVGVVVFSPDGKTLATASLDGTARLWDWRPQPELHLVGRDPTSASAVAFSADGSVLTSVGANGSVRRWRLPNALVLKRSFGGSAVHAVALSRDGRLGATAGIDSPVQVWDVASGRLVRTLSGSGEADALSFSSDGGMLATVASDGTVRLWRLDDGTLSRTLRSRGMEIVAASFSADGRRVVTAGRDRLGRVWNAETGKLELTLTGHGARLTSASFSPDGRFIVTTSYDHDARVWSARTGDLVWLLRDQASFAVVTNASFSSDNRWVVTAGPGFAGVWDMSTGRPLYLLNGREQLLTAASFAPHGWRIATGGLLGNVRTYDCKLCGPIDDLEHLAQRRLADLRR